MRSAQKRKRLITLTSSEYFLQAGSRVAQRASPRFEPCGTRRSPRARWSPLSVEPGEPIPELHGPTAGGIFGAGVASAVPAPRPRRSPRRKHLRGALKASAPSPNSVSGKERESGGHADRIGQLIFAAGFEPLTLRSPLLFVDFSPQSYC